MKEENKSTNDFIRGLYALVRVPKGEIEEGQKEDSKKKHPTKAKKPKT